MEITATAPEPFWTAKNGDDGYIHFKDAAGHLARVRIYYEPEDKYADEEFAYGLAQAIGCLPELLAACDKARGNPKLSDDERQELAAAYDYATGWYGEEFGGVRELPKLDPPVARLLKAARQAAWYLHWTVAAHGDRQEEHRQADDELCEALWAFRDFPTDARDPQTVGQHEDGYRNALIVTAGNVIGIVEERITPRGDDSDLRTKIESVERSKPYDHLDHSAVKVHINEFLRRKSIERRHEPLRLNLDGEMRDYEEIATLVIVARDALETLKDAGRMTSYFQLIRALEPFEHYPVWRSPIYRRLYGKQ